MFQKLDLFPLSAEGWETPTLLDPLERAKHHSFNHPVIEVSSF
jgi:hypothetical protein